MVFTISNVIFNAATCTHLAARDSRQRASADEEIADRPEGIKRATSVNVQLLCLQRDLRTGSIWRDIEFPLRDLLGQKWNVDGSSTFGAT